MGVLRLFSFLSRKYPTIIHPFQIPYYKDKTTRQYVINQKVQNEYTPGCEIVLLDLNAIFHPCCQKVFDYGQTEQKSLFWSNKKKEMSMEDLERMAFNMICNKIEEIVKISNPSKAIYLAIDGVPGLCKQAQQRQRRFRSAMASKNESTKNAYGFNSNCITTGTMFMDRLCQHIYFWIKKKKRFEWGKLKIYYNNMYVPGEGEHKLVRFLEQTISKGDFASTGTKFPFKNITIMSPDADLIMLSLTLLSNHASNKITILRENVFDTIQGDYLFVDVNDLKKNIVNDIRSESIEFTFDEQYAIRDYVFFSFLIGNDFLPNVPSLEISNKGIDILFQVYSDNWAQNGYLIQDIGKRIIVNGKALSGLLKGLGELEIKMLLEKFSKGYAKFPDRVLNRHIVRTTQGTNIEFQSYRLDYYKTKFEIMNEEDIENVVKKICYEYLLGMVFVLRYYFKSIPTFSWFYPYHYAPFFQDLYKASLEFDFMGVKFNPDRPLSMVESLIGIMPPSSFDMLPATARDLMERKIILDSDFLEEFEIDLDGKQQEYEGILLLPFLSYEKIKRLTQKLELTEEEEKYNKIGDVYVF